MKNLSDSGPGAPRAIALIAIATLVVFIGLTLGILRWVPRPDNTYLWLEMYNWGHVWLFAGVMLVTTWAITQSLPRLSFAWQLAAAAAFSASVAGGSELMQINVSGRNADIFDFGRDLAGISIGISAALFWRYLTRPSPRILRAAVISIAIAVPQLLLATWPVVDMLRAYDDRGPSLPVLFSPDRRWSRSFVRNVRSKLSYSGPPEGFVDFEGQNCLHVRTSLRRYSGAEFPDLHPDWSDYQTLHVEMWSGARKPLPFLIRLDGASDPYMTDDWANYKTELAPGSNELVIVLDRLVNAGSKAKFDVSGVFNIVAVTTDNSKRHDLCIGAITLG